MRLVLVRHGQTASNVARLLDTALPGPDLTDLGRDQADALVTTLAGEPVDAVWASAAVRARSTAAPLALARGLEVLVSADLREVGAGKLEMSGDRRDQRRYLAAVFAWAAGDLAASIPGGESGPGALARVDAVVTDIAAHGVGSAVVVSHGATIRLWVGARARGLPGDWAATHPLLNTGIVVVDGDPGTGWHVKTWAGAPVPSPSGPDGPDGPDGPAGPAGPAGELIGGEAGAASFGG